MLQQPQQQQRRMQRCQNSCSSWTCCSWTSLRRQPCLRQLQQGLGSPPRWTDAAKNRQGSTLGSIRARHVPWSSQPWSWTRRLPTAVTCPSSPAPTQTSRWTAMTPRSLQQRWQLQLQLLLQQQPRPWRVVHRQPGQGRLRSQARRGRTAVAAGAPCRQRNEVRRLRRPGDEAAPAAGPACRPAPRRAPQPPAAALRVTAVRSAAVLAPAQAASPAPQPCSPPLRSPMHAVSRCRPHAATAPPMHTSSPTRDAACHAPLGQWVRLPTAPCHLKPGHPWCLWATCPHTATPTPCPSRTPCTPRRRT